MTVTIYSSLISAVVGTLNFVVSLIYNFVADWAVEKENHA